MNNLKKKTSSKDVKPLTEYEFAIAYEEGLIPKEVIREIPYWRIKICTDHLHRDKRVQKLLKAKKISGVKVRYIYEAYGNEKEAVAEILRIVKERKQ